MSESVFARRAVLAVSVIAFAGILAVHPTWARAIGADVWNVPALKEQLRETESEYTRLTTEDDEVRNRIAVKESLVMELIAERMTLAEVTEQFLTLDAEKPAYMDVLRSTYPAATDREAMARNVIAYTLPRVASDERVALSNRLETNLHQMLSGQSN